MGLMGFWFAKCCKFVIFDVKLGVNDAISCVWIHLEVGIWMPLGVEMILQNGVSFLEREAPNFWVLWTRGMNSALGYLKI